MGEYRIDYEEIWRNEDNGYKGPMSTKLFLQSWKELSGEQNNGMTLSFQAFQHGISIIRSMDQEFFQKPQHWGLFSMKHCPGVHVRLQYVSMK
jgi:hypothetical protein